MPASAQGMDFAQIKKQTSESVERQIERFYTQQILSGLLPAGSRLPSNLELATLWSTSCASVQRALARLVAEGLLERARSRGTFVRNRQERSLIGVLVGPDLVNAISWHYRALLEAIDSEIDSEFLSTRVYSGLSRSLEPSRFQSRKKHLLLDRKFHVFSGFIEIATAQIPPDILPHDVPKAIYDPMRPDNDFAYDYADCGREIAAALAGHDLAKTWLVSSYFQSQPSNAGNECAAAILKQLPKDQVRRMEEVRVPFFPTSADLEACVHDALMEKMASVPRKDLPKAIVVTDDVSMRAVVLVLLKRGLRIPEDIRLFVITSEGTEVYYSVPAYKYILPTHALAKSLVSLLKQRIAGDHTHSGEVRLKGWTKSA